MLMMDDWGCDRHLNLPTKQTVRLVRKDGKILRNWYGNYPDEKLCSIQWI